MTKSSILALIGIGGAAIAEMLGGWDMLLSTLCIFMVLDYITGLIVGGVFHNSPKTSNGALESKASYKGLFRKFGVLILVLVATHLDSIVGGEMIRNTIIIAFIVNESLSLVENIGLMGVPIPEKLTQAIELLQKGKENDE